MVEVPYFEAVVGSPHAPRRDGVDLEGAVVPAVPILRFVRVLSADLGDVEGCPGPAGGVASKMMRGRYIILKLYQAG